MFKRKSNATFNNILFNGETMGVMHKSAERLYEAAKSMRKVTGQSNLAKLLNQSPQAIKNWENRGVSQSGARIAQKLIGCDSNWLLEGVGQMVSGHEVDNISAGPMIRGTVPLISNVQAGMYTEFVDNLHPPDEGYEQIPTTVPVNRYTFALRVHGDSMEPEFKEGMLLVVEPELDPQPGDYVIAKNGSEETTFKQLTKDGADWYLKPLNERYPIKPLGSNTIIGVVRATQKRFR